MSELQLCHWLLLDPNGKCRSVFAPAGDNFENYKRVGAAASSSQFVFPMVFAVSEERIPLHPFSKGESESQVCWTIVLMRDDRHQPGPAFPEAASLKVATLISELSLVTAEWIEAVGAKFRSIQLGEDPQNSLKLAFITDTNEPLRIRRCIELVRAGLEMMAVARGLKVSFS